MQTLHLLIKGKVQRVSYRATAKSMAEKIGVKGWVRNTEDGNVEAVISGTIEKVQQFADWSGIGPSGAKVTQLVITEIEETSFDTFAIKGKL